MLVLWWVACGGGEGDPEVEVVPAEVSASEPVTCEDASARDAGWFVEERRDGTIADDRQGLTGAALLVEDLDDDGALDLLVPVDRATDGAVVFWGRGDGTFDRDGETFAGVDGSVAASASAADIDADGDLDVLIAGWQAPQQLLVNAGGRTFVPSSDRFAGGASRRSQSASWGDADGDGDLDLFVGAYGQRAVIDVRDSEPDCSDHISDRSELWINDGTGHFSDASNELPDAVHDGYTFASGWFDVDDDSIPELFLANDDGLCAPSVIMRREPDGGLVADAEAGFHAGSHDMGLAVGDLNDDQRPDFLLTSWNRITYLESTTTPAGLKWVNATAARGIEIAATPAGQPAAPGEQVFGWGAEWGDLDNDGDLDAVVVFGYWDDYPGPADPETQADAVFVQTDGAFRDRAPELGLDDDAVGRSVVLADLDGNGMLDMVRRVLDGPNTLHLQRCSGDAWVTVRLRDPGGLNRFAVGARVTVVAGERRQTRWVTSGSTGLYTGSPMQVHVGLGDAETIDQIAVRWPDGTESRLTDLVPRRHLTITRTR